MTAPTNLELTYLRDVQLHRVICESMQTLERKRCERKRGLAPTRIQTNPSRTSSSVSVPFFARTWDCGLLAGARNPYPRLPNVAAPRLHADFPAGDTRRGLHPSWICVCLDPSTAVCPRKSPVAEIRPCPFFTLSVRRTERHCRPAFQAGSAACTRI